MPRVASLSLSPVELREELLKIEAEERSCLEALQATAQYICNEPHENFAKRETEERYTADKAVIVDKFRRDKEEVLHRLRELEARVHKCCTEDEQCQPKDGKKRRLACKNTAIGQQEQGPAIHERHSATKLGDGTDSQTEQILDVDKPSEEEISPESLACIDEEEGDDKLTVEEQRREITRIEETKLQMTLQGLRQAGKQNDHLQENSSRKAHGRAATPKYDCFVFQGSTFRQGRCYRYRQDDLEATVGIIDFVSPEEGGPNDKTKALCVLVVPFQDTFLGIEDPDVDYKARYTPPERFVRVREEPVLLSLGNIIGECEDPYHIPKLTYEPQTPGSWCNFAYLFDDDAVKKERSGRRPGGLRVLDLFAGAGGMAQGFANAGFTTVHAVEQDCTAVETFTKNQQDASVYPGDIQGFLQKCRSCGKYKRQLGRVDHIHGSCPCQGFSGANRTGGKNDRANNERTKDFVEAIRMFMPTTATFENVQGMWRRKHLHYLKNILIELLELGYQMRCCLLKACDYGDPQKRARILIFCARDFAHLPSLPYQTHGPGRIPFITVRDALEGLHDNAFNDREQDDITLPDQTAAITASDAIRLHAHALAPTIRASASALPLHYAENRRITIAEAAALQSFPNHYEFVGTRSEQCRQIGNAVPVEMATAVALSVRKSLLYLYAQEKDKL